MSEDNTTICETCAAVIADAEKHANWHRAVIQEATKATSKAQAFGGVG